MKRDLVILEGPNASGKSTIFKALQREVDYQLLVLDRFLGSHIVFDGLRDRENYTMSQYFYIEEQLLDIFNPLVVYLHAPLDILQTRYSFRKDAKQDSFDGIERKPEDFVRVIELYDIYLSYTPLDIMRIDTSKLTEEATVKAIIHCLEERRY